MSIMTFRRDHAAITAKGAIVSSFDSSCIVIIAHFSQANSKHEVAWQK